MSDHDANRKLHELEQSLALMADNLPPAWKRLYDNNVKVGFNEDQAFKMVMAFIVANAGGTIKL